MVHVYLKIILDILSIFPLKSSFSLLNTGTHETLSATVLLAQMVEPALDSWSRKFDSHAPKALELHFSQMVSVGILNL